MIQLDIQSRTKKSESDSQCCWESDSTQKPPTPQPWVKRGKLCTDAYGTVLAKQGVGVRIWAFCKEPELSLKFEAGAGAMAIWVVAPVPFLDTKSFAKFIES